MPGFIGSVTAIDKLESATKQDLSVYRIGGAYKSVMPSGMFKVGERVLFLGAVTEVERRSPLREYVKASKIKKKKILGTISDGIIFPLPKDIHLDEAAFKYYFVYPDSRGFGSSYLVTSKGPVNRPQAPFWHPFDEWALPFGKAVSKFTNDDLASYIEAEKKFPGLYMHCSAWNLSTCYAGFELFVFNPDNVAFNNLNPNLVTDVGNGLKAYSTERTTTLVLSKANRMRSNKELHESLLSVCSENPEIVVHLTYPWAVDDAEPIATLIDMRDRCIIWNPKKAKGPFRMAKQYRINTPLEKGGMTELKEMVDKELATARAIVPDYDTYAKTLKDMYNRACGNVHQVDLKNLHDKILSACLFLNAYLFTRIEDYTKEKTRGSAIRILPYYYFFPYSGLTKKQARKKTRQQGNVKEESAFLCYFSTERDKEGKEKERRAMLLGAN